MKLPRRQLLHLAAGAAALSAVSRFAWAQKDAHQGTSQGGEHGNAVVPRHDRGVRNWPRRS